MTVINPEALQKLVDICTELAMPIPIACTGAGRQCRVCASCSA